MNAHENEIDPPDVDDAQRAVAESRRASVDTDEIIAQARRGVESLRRIREANHFADKFRLIIQGH